MIRGNLLAFFSTRWLLGSDGECYKTVKIALDSKIFSVVCCFNSQDIVIPPSVLGDFFLDFLLTSFISLRWCWCCFTKFSNFLCPTLQCEMCVETALSEISSLPNYKFSSLLLVTCCAKAPPTISSSSSATLRPVSWSLSCAAAAGGLLQSFSSFFFLHHSIFIFGLCVVFCCLTHSFFSGASDDVEEVEEKKKNWLFSMNEFSIWVAREFGYLRCARFDYVSLLRHLLYDTWWKRFFFLSRTHLLHHTLSSLCRFLCCWLNLGFFITHLFALLVRCLLLSIIFFFVCFSFAPIDSESVCRSVKSVVSSSSSVRRLSSSNLFSIP